MNIRPALPAYCIKSLRRDRNGIYSGQIAVPHPMDGDRPSIPLAWLAPSSAPVVWSLPVIGVSADVQPPLCWVLFDYQGLDTSGEDVELGDDEVTFELDTSMAEEPIETHPKFLSSLKDKHGWDQNERNFAETLSSTTTSGTTGLGGQEKKGAANPLFGVDSWLSVGVIYRKTYASRVIPSRLLTGIGTIVNRPPDIGVFALPTGIGKRNWLKLAPKLVRTGNAVRITEEWMLSGPRGWLPELYSTSQLGASSGGAGLDTGGLTTGGL